MGGCHSGELAVNPVTNRIYVTNQDTNSVTVIDGATDTVVTTISVGDQPRGVEVNPVTNLIYVTNIVSNTLSVIDGATNTVVGTIAVGANPSGVTVNSQTNRIYVADSSGNDVSIVNGNTNTVLATVPVGLSPGGLAILPGLSRVYVSQGDHSVAVIEDLLYSFTGFFQPVDNPGPGPTFLFNIAKAGSAIPIKFSLGGNQGLNIFASGFPASQPIPCDASSSTDVIEQTLTAGSSSLSYDAATDQYVYVWKTNKAWSNSCRQLIVQLNDGTSHRAYFKFTK
jgi:YVTN family beta-propeller protein